MSSQKDYFKAANTDEGWLTSKIGTTDKQFLLLRD